MEKHLEFIQGVINRHNSNSFLIKGWTITLASAIYALSGAIGEEIVTLISIGPILIFWILDSIFLANERSFISLYNCVANSNELIVNESTLRRKFRTKNDSEVHKTKTFKVTLFSMNFGLFKEIKRNNWWITIYSSTIIWFYLAMLIVSILVYTGLKTYSNPPSTKYDINATITNDELRIKSESPIQIQIDTLKSDSIK